MSDKPAGQKVDDKTVRKGKGSFLSSKLIVFGIPVFLLQVVVIYFLIAKFIIPATNGSRVTAATHEQESARTGDGSDGSKPGAAENGSPESDTENPEDSKETGEENIYVVKDLIINPAGTNGTRFLLTTIGFKMSNAKSMSEMEKKDMQVRDILNTLLTSKTLDQLVAVKSRDSLRNEIGAEIRKVIKGGSLHNVFFGKFIVQ